MVGFGTMGPMSWVFGALAMVAIWGGVWWGLSAFVFHWPARERPRPPEPASDAAWEQPDFGASLPRGPSGPEEAVPRAAPAPAAAQEDQPRTGSDPR